MEKIGRDSLLLGNWRPLTRLNVDYKILAKVLANHLHEILDKLIHIDQSGFMKGRYIGENLLDLLSTIEYCNRYNTEGIIALILRKLLTDWSGTYSTKY